MQIKEILKSKYNLSQKNSEQLISHMEQVTYSKKEIIQKADTMDYYIYFVESGLIRSFISRDGREITLWIVPEGGTPISSSGLTKPGISKITIDAVTDCILWRVSCFCQFHKRDGGECHIRNRDILVRLLWSG